MPQITSPLSQIMPLQQHKLLQSLNLVGIRNVALFSIPPIGAAFIGTRMVQNNRNVIDFLKKINLPTHVQRDRRFYLGFNCATVAPVGAAAYIIWKTGGFGCKDTGYALSLLGATGLCGLLLIPGFMNKNLTWITVNAGVFAVHAMVMVTTAAFWQIERTAGALMTPLAIWATFCTITITQYCQIRAGKTMKLKIELPLETWTEVFGFLSRSQLKQIVPHIGEEKTIGHRQFVSFVQFFLHQYSEVTLGKLHIISLRNGNEPMVIVNKNNRMPLPLAVVPIPENVKNFESIRISNYGQSVLAFLQEFQRNSLLTDVNLCFCKCQCLYQNQLLQIMTNFLPLFTNITSIIINRSVVLDQLQCEHSELAIPMFTSAKVLIADYNCRDVWFCDWLHIPREDGKPRVLFLYGYCDNNCLSSLSHFIKHIKKDFLEASQAVSFFIKLKKFRDFANVQFQSLTMENGQTQEILVIKGVNENTDYVTISRYPMGTNEKEWNEEMKEHPTIDNRQIIFDA